MTLSAPTRTARGIRLRARSGRLREPLPGAEIVEDHEVGAPRAEHLPVAPAQRPPSPPAVLHQPRLANLLDRPAVDLAGCPAGTHPHTRRARQVEGAVAAHWASFGGLGLRLTRPALISVGSSRQAHPGRLTRRTG